VLLIGWCPSFNKVDGDRTKGAYNSHSGPDRGTEIKEGEEGGTLSIQSPIAMHLKHKTNRNRPLSFDY